MQIPYLPVRGRKLPSFIGGSIGPRMEICGNSGLPIPMVPHFHESNGYMKSKLRAWRVQKCIALVGVMLGNIGSRKKICETSGRKVPMVPCLNQSNDYMKRKLREWRFQKCIGLVGADIVLISAGPQITSCHGGLYRVQKGNMQIFGPTNPHGTVFVPKQWLYEEEATGMESSKMYCPGRCRYRTYQCGAAIYPVSWGGYI